MKPKNPIINAHKKSLREARATRLEIESSLPKPTQLIAMEEYCPVARPRDMHELLIEAVQKEDIINHKDFNAIVEPTLTTIVKSLKLTPTATVAFFRTFVP